MTNSGDKSGCGHWNAGTLLPDNDYDMYLYITQNSDGSGVLDNNHVSVTAKIGEATSTIETFGEFE